MAKKPKPITDRTRVRVLINGQGCYCRIGDICSRGVLEVVDMIKAERAKGGPCIGYGMTTSTGHNVQIDIM